MRFLLPFCLVLLSACVDTKKADLDAWSFQTRLNGGLRTDRDPSDAKLDADILQRNFRKIAFEFEEDPFGTGRQFDDGEHQIPMIRRWEQEIRLSVAIDSGVKTSARRDTYAFMRRLKLITGVDFKISNAYKVSKEQEESANLLVFLGDGDFFDQFIAAFYEDAKTWDAENQEASAAILEFLDTWHASYSPCAGSLYTELGEDGETPNGKIIAAIVAIRTDLAEPNTQSCIEEELAQTMGLPNDSADVRPSMFNDDGEFALMTRHDALLLQILYDNRLKAGMTPEQSMPIVRRIAAELLSEG